MDAYRIADQLNEPREDGAVHEAANQIAFADIILVRTVTMATVCPILDTCMPAKGGVES